MEFTWPIAFAAIGVSVTLFTFLYKMLKGDTVDIPKQIGPDLETRVHDLEVKAEYTEKEIEELKTETNNLWNSIKDLIDKFINFIQKN